VALAIRCFQNEDARKVAYLIHKALRESNSRDYPPRIIRAVGRLYTPARLRAAAVEYTVFVAAEGERILGTATLAGEYIQGMFVNPRYQGKGIGRKLMDHAERAAERRGVPAVKLNASLTAVDFYSRLGYRKVRNVFSEEGGKAVLMRKPLGP
jgi:GNAT superfamily N-acetyltransferase